MVPELIMFVGQELDNMIINSISLKIAILLFIAYSYIGFADKWNIFLMELLWKRKNNMSMELHTLRAVKITKNIFELQRVNTELRKFQQVVEVLEIRKSELENSF